MSKTFVFAVLFLAVSAAAEDWGEMTDHGGYEVPDIAFHMRGKRFNHIQSHSACGAQFSSSNI